MNRRQRRAAGQHREIRVIPRAPGSTLQEAAACPDCTADVAIVAVAPRVFQAEVRHDEICPWLAAFERRAGVR